MGTHPIFESDFDCLTARGSRTNPRWLILRLTRSVRSWTRRRTSETCPSSPTSITESQPSLTHLSVKLVSSLAPRLARHDSLTLVRTNKNVASPSSLPPLDRFLDKL